jgi:outer membrane protein OmpA-like peptidoglycan-associated protein
MGDFRITDNWSVGLEVNANVLPDSYNSKNASSGDWTFNALVGVKYAFGKTNVTREKAPCCQPKIEYVEKVVEKIVEKKVPVEVVKEVVVEPLRREIFFALNSTKITNVEMQKIKDIADYLKTNAKAKVSIVGHADKGTGNAAINKRISEKRAQKVADVLVKNFGISSDRIDFNSLGDTEQPFSKNDMNRVCICIAK